MISPEHIKWIINLDKITDPFELFSKKTRKKVKVALKKLEESEYKFKLEPVTEELMNKFAILYKKNIEAKEGGLVFDVYSYIQKNQKIRQYNAISLYKNDTFLGALIFSNREKSFNAVYKVFPKSLKDLKLPINITFLAEYNFLKTALAEHKEFVKHGKDRNFSGINSNPGLAMFKMQIACKPQVSEENKNFIELTPPENNSRDIIAFHGSSNDEKITDATLYLYKTTEEEANAKYGPLLKSDIETTIINKIKN